MNDCKPLTLKAASYMTTLMMYDIIILGVQIQDCVEMDDLTYIETVNNVNALRMNISMKDENIRDKLLYCSRNGINPDSVNF